VGDHTGPSSETPPIGSGLEVPPPPPPPRPPDPREIPPPPPMGPPAGRRRLEAKAAIVALSSAGVGWLIWIYGWIAESDTGYPDGLACTGNAAASEAYASCMRSSERAGTIAWAVTLGVAVFGLVVLARCRPGHRVGAGARVLTVVAWAMSTLLAAAGARVWVRGAGGGFYEARSGATSWHLAMVVAVAAGLIGGWLFTNSKLSR